MDNKKLKTFEIINCTEEKIELPCKVHDFKDWLLTNSIPEKEVTDLESQVDNYRHLMVEYLEVIKFYCCLYALGNAQPFIYSGTTSSALRVPKETKHDPRGCYTRNFTHSELIKTLVKENSIKKRFKRKGLPTLFIEDFFVTRADDTVGNRYLVELSSKYKIFLCRLPENFYKNIYTYKVEQFRFSEYLNDYTILSKK